MKNEDKSKDSGILNTRKNRQEIYRLKNAWIWKGMAICMFFLFLIMLAYNFLITIRPKNEIPYVVEIDTSNGMQSIKNAVALKDYTYTEQVMVNTVRKFIINLRRVGTDATDNAERANEVYAYVTGDALSYIKNFYMENNPNVRNKDVRVEVVVYNAMPIKSSGLKFQVDWNESVYNVNTNRLLSEKNYRADIDAKQYTATKDTKERNPLGFYITYLYISEIKDGYVVKTNWRE